MIRISLLVALASIAACGGDDDCCTIDAAGGGGDGPRSDMGGGGDGGMCVGGGTGTVTGSVMGVQISPIMSAEQIDATSLFGIVLDEVASVSCDGQPGTTGEHLVLIFCNPPASGTTYPIVGEQAFGCPSANAAALIEQNGGADFAAGTGGSVTISSALAGCTSGTFTAQFGTDTLTGSFDANVCP